MKKRGISLPPQVLILLIMVIIAGILIFIFAVKAPQALCNGKVQTCRTSLLLAERGETFGFDMGENCPASKIDPFKRESPEEVNEIIAKELEKCVFKFGGGKVKFETALNLIARDWQSKNFCFKCAELDFSVYTKKEAYKKANQEGQHFYKYLQENDIHCSKPKISFFKYFQDITNAYPGNSTMVVDAGPINIDPEKNYLIYMNSFKEGRFLGGLRRSLEATTPYALFNVGGALQLLLTPTPTQTTTIVRLVPADSEILKECTLILG